jgi:secreted trypsin-like serine protease
MNLKPTRRPWRRRLTAIAVVTVLLLVMALPVFAISYGVPDGNAHPFVGSMVLRIDGDVFQVCSGTLISPTVFLTASHCTVFLDDFLASNPGAELLVTFDPAISAGSTFYTGVWHTNPGYLAGNGASDTGDIAVIVLDQSPGIPPASLPTAGLLDQLKASHVLKDTRFTAVGYGTIRETKTKGPQSILDNMERRRADQGFLSLTNAWLTLAMNQSTGNGGGCYGDSGGPHFIHLNGVETNIVASITVTGDANCVATDKTYRTDTPGAREFLSHYVILP